MILAMCLFSLSMSISPGPVNMVALSSGVNQGVGKTIPFISGATFSFTLLLFVTGLGLGVLVQQFPLLLKALKVVGTFYIAYMGWCIARSGGNINAESRKVASFQSGALMQWINPKAWIACISGISGFGIANQLNKLFLFVGLYFVICYLCITLWAYAGDKVSHYIASEVRMSWFNRVMGICLIVIAVKLLITDVII